MNEILVTVFCVIATILLIISVALVIVFKPNKISRQTIWFFIPVFLAGLIVSYIGLKYQGTQGSDYYTFVYAMIISIKMFGFSIIDDMVSFATLDLGIYYQVITISTYLLASLNTVLVMFLFIFGNVKKYIALLLVKRKKKYFVIFGDDNKAITLSSSIKENCILYFDKKSSSEYTLPLASIKQYKSVFLYENYESIISKFKSSDKGVIFVFYLSDASNNINMALKAKNILNSKSKIYVYYDSAYFNNKIKTKDFFEGKDVYLFNTNQIIVNDLFMKHHLLAFLPDEMVNYKKGTLASDKKINYFMIGNTDLNMLILEKLVSNYVFDEKGIDISIFQNKISNDYNATSFVDLFYFNHYGLDINEKLASKQTDNNEYYELASLNINLKPINNVYETTSSADYILKEMKDYNFFFVDCENDKKTQECVISLNSLLQSRGLDNYKILCYTNKKNFIFEYGNDGNIIPFGSEEDIISQSFIIDENLDLLAKKVNLFYSGTDDTGKMDEFWNNLSSLNKESNRAAILSSINKLNLLNYDLVYTLDSATDDSEMFDFDYNIDGEDEEGARMNLARCEHIRWNIFQLMNNVLPLEKKYIFENKKYNKTDPKKTKHANILSFKGLVDLQNDMIKYKNEGYKITDNDVLLVYKDMQLMDNLQKIVEGTNYKIVKKRK